MAAMGASMAVASSTNSFRSADRRGRAASAPNTQANARHIRHHHDRGSNRGRDGANQNVAMLDVRQFVGDDAFELRRREETKDAFGGRHGRDAADPARWRTRSGTCQE
jgi:hypothetical protein